MIARFILAWRIVRRTFHKGLAFSLFAAWLTFLHLLVGAGRLLDPLFFPRLRSTRVERPVIVVGLPRTGTTFMQRFLADNGVGVGQRVWRMIYSSLTVQALIKPFMPILERYSPTRFHAATVHETNLMAVEVDDVALLVRYFDGFFLYGFLLAFSEEDLRGMFDPSARDTSDRDFRWLEGAWRRNLAAEGKPGSRVVAKLFSAMLRLPRFLQAFPDARILYMARDPMSVIPSTMSLVTGVLDNLFGFWKLPEDLRTRYLERLYQALIELLHRFEDDWKAGRIPRDQVKVVQFERLMEDFDVLMDEILAFCEIERTPELDAAIKARAAKQKKFKSGHAYDLETYGLDADRIRRDCAFYYEAFLGGLPESAEAE